MKRSDRRNDDVNELDPRPESAMGGASDSGASGGHPVRFDVTNEGRSPLPEDAPGDAAIERRSNTNPLYQGKERRVAHR